LQESATSLAGGQLWDVKYSLNRQIKKPVKTTNHPLNVKVRYSTGASVLKNEAVPASIP